MTTIDASTLTGGDYSTLAVRVLWHKSRRYL